MSRSEQRAVGRAFTRAFFDDPGFVHVLPRPLARRRALPAVFADAARDARCHGHAMVAGDEQGIAGALLWFEAGGYPPDERRVLRSMPAQLRAALWAPTRLRVGSAVLEVMHRHQPATPFLYVATLAVDPSRHGTGVGSLLLGGMLEATSGSGLPTYLETTRPANRSWYARFGFAEREELTLGPGGPPAWTMLRPAAMG